MAAIFLISLHLCSSFITSCSARTRCRWPIDAILAAWSPSSARSAQRDIRETSFPAIFLPIFARALWENLFFLYFLLFSLSFFLSLPQFHLLLRSEWSKYLERAKERNREKYKKAPLERWPRRAAGYNFISYHETNEWLLWDAPVGRKIFFVFPLM